MNTRTLLAKAIDIAGGSQTKLGEACGCSQNAIHQALKIGRVSAKLAVKIDNATKGAVPAHLLCPDLPWPQRRAESTVRR
jgi:DNA-binding transcriptional regulator YdaS (Cro superfamily)